MVDSDTEANKKQGTRVFKKSSPNGKLTVYLSRRDFVDHLTHADPIEGVVLLDSEYIKNRRVFVHVLAAFRYGREDLDVLGLTFRKDLFLASVQVFPSDVPGEDGLPWNPTPSIAVATSENATTAHNNTAGKTVFGEASNETTDNSARPLTRLQERLIKKLGTSAHPFYFELPNATPASVTLQPGTNDSGKPCGVDYELRAYVAEDCEERPQKRPIGCFPISRAVTRPTHFVNLSHNPRNSVRLAIRKLTYAPEEPAPQPSAEVVKDFIMSPGTLRLEVSLDKEMYYHGEFISINVLVDNNSNKTVKKIKISVRQWIEVCLYADTALKCVVDVLETTITDIA